MREQRSEMVRTVTVSPAQRVGDTSGVAVGTAPARLGGKLGPPTVVGRDDALVRAGPPGAAGGDAIAMLGGLRDAAATETKTVRLLFKSEELCGP